MKQELTELKKSYEEWQNETREIQLGKRHRTYNKGIPMTHEEAVKHCEELNERDKGRSLLQTKIESLEKRVLIREEALDLLKEAGLVNEREKKPLPAPQMALAVVVVAFVYHFLNFKRADQTDILPLPQPD